MAIKTIVLFAVLQIFAVSLAAEDRTPLYWNTQATETLDRALDLEELNKNQAKNVIFFLGDGMGIPTVTAARILKGQLMGNPGEETLLSWENLPYAALSKTYNTNQQVPDSAGTATAFFCGVKSYAGAIGVDGTGERGNCASSINTHVPSILEEAVKANKSTGVVSTARLTHATPACTYAHVPDRNWESSIPVLEQRDGCTDIAAQFIDHPDIRVALGGGRREFLKNTDPDPEVARSFGRRTDGRNLVDEWLEGHPTDAAYVWNQEQFDAVDPDKTEYLLGLFQPSHMQFEAVRSNDSAGEPSIAEMTEKAIRILKKNENGFFLAVEAGRIDHAHHSTSAYNALYDTVAFDEAVQTALDMTSFNETLIIVTADHSHTLAFAGYPERGHDILGKLGAENTEDGLPYTTLGYLNGPGGNLATLSFLVNGNRPNHTDRETNSILFINEALVPLASETHGGEDVAIYAGGPFAHLFAGVHQQNYIAHVMRYAACLGEGRQVCTDPPEVPTDKECGGTTVNSMSVLLLFIAMTLIRWLI